MQQNTDEKECVPAVQELLHALTEMVDLYMAMDAPRGLSLISALTVIEKYDSGIPTQRKGTKDQSAYKNMIKEIAASKIPFCDGYEIACQFKKMAQELLERDKDENK